MKQKSIYETPAVELKFFPTDVIILAASGSTENPGNGDTKDWFNY